MVYLDSVFFKLYFGVYLEFKIFVYFYKFVKNFSIIHHHPSPATTADNFPLLFFFLCLSPSLFPFFDSSSPLFFLIFIPRPPFLPHPNLAPSPPPYFLVTSGLEDGERVVGWAGGGSEEGGPG